MRRRLLFCGLLGLLLASTVASAQDKSKYASTIDYIQKTGKLWGIKAVSIRDQASVKLIDADKSGQGYTLELFDSKTNSVKEVELKPGEYCYLSDGYHAFIKYQLESIDKDIATFLVRDVFDSRSFGLGLSEEIQTVPIKSYSD